MKNPKSYWGIAVGLVYTAFAVSTLGFVAFAMTMPVDLVSADYYQRSLVEDRKIEATNNARRLGGDVGVTVNATARQLVVRVPTAAAVGSLTLYRPAHSVSDTTMPLALVDGHQTVDLSGLPRGRWLVQMTWTSAGKPYYYEAGVQVP